MCSQGVLLLATLTPLLVACATSQPREIVRRRFDFQTDTFAYTNNNYWLYDLEAPSGGLPVVKRRLENVDHGHRCTIMSRAVRQFLYTARFAAEAPRVSDAEYRSLVQRVLDSDPRSESPIHPRVTIPGYPDLRSFSLERDQMLKAELGGKWTGFRQRGNWRMIFAFSPSHQRATARELVEDLRGGHLPMVHIVNFPAVNINHTALLFGFEETPLEIRYLVYDPNNADEPVSLVFERATATFHYARTDYFPGGPAKVYEVYDGLFF